MFASLSWWKWYSECMPSERYDKNWNFVLGHYYLLENHLLSEAGTDLCQVERERERNTHTHSLTHTYLVWKIARLILDPSKILDIEQTHRPQGKLCKYLHSIQLFMCVCRLHCASPCVWVGSRNVEDAEMDNKVTGLHTVCSCLCQVQMVKVIIHPTQASGAASG